MAKPNDHYDPDLTNAELKRLIDKTMTRFENWRVEVETQPNPHMVHTLRNIVSVIDSVTSVYERKVHSSYKLILKEMAQLVSETAELNLSIARALERDDFLDQDEEKKITERLFSLVNAAMNLIRVVQEGFGQGREAMSLPIRLSIEDQSQVAEAVAGPRPAKRRGKA